MEPANPIDRSVESLQEVPPTEPVNPIDGTLEPLPESAPTEPVNPIDSSVKLIFERYFGILGDLDQLPVERVTER